MFIEKTHSKFKQCFKLTGETDENVLWKLKFNYRVEKSTLTYTTTVAFYSITPSKGFS